MGDNLGDAVRQLLPLCITSLVGFTSMNLYMWNVLGFNTVLMMEIIGSSIIGITLESSSKLSTSGRKISDFVTVASLGILSGNVFGWVITSSFHAALKFANIIE